MDLASERASVEYLLFEIGQKLAEIIFSSSLLAARLASSSFIALVRPSVRPSVLMAGRPAGVDVRWKRDEIEGEEKLQ